MKLKNTSKFATPFVRKMVAWVRDEVGVPAKSLRRATFRNRNRRHWSGHAWSNGRIVVSINADTSTYGHGGVRWSGYKRACKPIDGSDYLSIMDPIEALVAVTAHELGHVLHFRLGKSGRGSEGMADPRARYVLRKFRERRAELMAAWGEPVPIAPATEPATVAATATTSLVERRAAKAAAMLAKWERKMKLAQGRVRKYRRTVNYYERKAASK